MFYRYGRSTLKTISILIFYEFWNNYVRFWNSNTHCYSIKSFGLILVDIQQSLWMTQNGYETSIHNIKNKNFNEVKHVETNFLKVYSIFKINNINMLLLWNKKYWFKIHWISIKIEMCMLQRYRYIYCVIFYVRSVNSYLDFIFFIFECKSNILFRI